MSLIHFHFPGCEWPRNVTGTEGESEEQEGGGWRLKNTLPYFAVYNAQPHFCVHDTQAYYIHYFTHGVYSLYPCMMGILLFPSKIWAKRAHFTQQNTLYIPFSHSLTVEVKVQTRPGSRRNFERKSFVWNWTWGWAAVRPCQRHRGKTGAEGLRAVTQWNPAP